MRGHDARRLQRDVGDPVDRDPGRDLDEQRRLPRHGQEPARRLAHEARQLRLESIQEGVTTKCRRRGHRPGKLQAGGGGDKDLRSRRATMPICWPVRSRSRRYEKKRARSQLVQSAAGVDRAGRDTGAREQQPVRGLQIDVPFSRHAARRRHHHAGVGGAAQLRRRTPRPPRRRPRSSTSRSPAPAPPADRPAARPARRPAREPPQAARPRSCRASRRARPRPRRCAGRRSAPGCSRRRTRPAPPPDRR